MVTKGKRVGESSSTKVKDWYMIITPNECDECGEKDLEKTIDLFKKDLAVGDELIVWRLARKYVVAQTLKEV